MFSLGTKLKSIYQIGRKGLDQVVNIGNKVRNVVKSSIFQDVLSALPSNIQTPLRIVGGLADRALTGAEIIQGKLNTGEDIAKRVSESVKSAMKSPEMKRQPREINVERMTPIEDNRIPMKTGSSNMSSMVNTFSNTNTMPTQLMSF